MMIIIIITSVTVALVSELRFTSQAPGKNDATINRLDRIFCTIGREHNFLNSVFFFFNMWNNRQIKVRK